MKLLAIPLVAAVLLAPPARAQFTGPSTAGAPTTAAAAAAARPGLYVTLTGAIISHLREDYFLFRDDSGEVRVEIGPEVWRGRPVGPETRVRLTGETDRSFAQTPYIWISALDILD